MPLVTVKLIEGVFDDAEKREMIDKVTEAMLEVEGEKLRDATLVILEEVKSGDWAPGGHPLTTDYVRSLRAGVPA
jgi:4-oxalocrotonate tautomerase